MAIHLGATADKFWPEWVKYVAAEEISIDIGLIVCGLMFLAAGIYIVRAIKKTGEFRWSSRQYDMSEDIVFWVIISGISFLVSMFLVYQADIVPAIVAPGGFALTKFLARCKRM